MYRNPHHKGFTLVELMVVISIIVVLITLVAVGIPIVMNMVHKAETRARIGNLDTLIGQAGYDLPDDSEAADKDIEEVNNDRLYEDLQEQNAGIKEDALVDGWGNPIMYDRIWEKNEEIDPDATDETGEDTDDEVVEEEANDKYDMLRLEGNLPGHPVLHKIKEEGWEYVPDQAFVDDDDPILREFQKYEYVIWSLGKQIYLDDDAETQQNDDDYDYEDDIITWGLHSQR